MTEQEARDLIFEALDDAGVSYDIHGQNARVKNLMALTGVVDVHVVRGGYRGTLKPRAVLGYTNSSRHGKRTYTLVADLERR